MATYICYPSHIGLLAASYCEGTKFATPEHRRRDARRVAHILAQQNIDSVIACYPDSKDGHRHGPTFIAGDGNDHAIINFAVLWADHYASKKVAASPIELIRLAHTLDCQSCETENYALMNAAKYIQQIIYTQTRKLKGYLEADDNWADQNPPESVRDFFASIDESQQ